MRSIVPTDFTRRSFVRSGIAALGASAIGCSSTSQPAAPAPSVSPRLTARPGTPSGTPTPGATDLGLESPRDGWLYVPTTYSAATATPLVVLLHGATGGAVNWLNYQTHAENRGFIALAIDTRRSTWDLILNGYGEDILFLDRALEHTFDLCNVDAARLALAGFSDGASYALSVGTSNGDLFSDVIAFSPGFLFREPIVGSPRIFISHGEADTILPVNLSRDQIVPSMQDDGYDVTYHEFVGGHEIPPAVRDTAFDWFLGPTG